MASDDDMVQKGLGWLLREAAKFNPKQTVAYLMTIRERSPRLLCYEPRAKRWMRRRGNEYWARNGGRRYKRKAERAV